jgi:hypothetical protein
MRQFCFHFHIPEENIRQLYYICFLHNPHKQPNRVKKLMGLVQQTVQLFSREGQKVNKFNVAKDTGMNIMQIQ